MDIQQQIENIGQEKCQQSQENFKICRLNLQTLTGPAPKVKSIELCSFFETEKMETIRQIYPLRQSSYLPFQKPPQSQKIDLNLGFPQNGFEDDIQGESVCVMFNKYIQLVSPNIFDDVHIICQRAILQDIMGIAYEKDKYLCYNVQVTPICGSYPEPIILNKEDQTENKVEGDQSSQKDDKEVNSQQQQQQHERFLFDDNLIPNGQNIYREAIMNDNFSTFITHVEKQMQNVEYKRRCEQITEDIENLNQEAQRLQTEIENINNGKQILSKDQQISLKLKQEDLDEIQYQVQQQVARKNEILYPQKRLFYGRSFETLCAGRPPNEETVLNQYGNPFVDFNYVEVVTLTNKGIKIGMAFEADTFRQQQPQLNSQSSSSNTVLKSESSNKTMNNSIEYIIQNNQQNEFITSKLNSVPPIFQSVELKTAFPPSSQRQKDNFYGKRMRNSWAQCYISGIPYIIFGFVDQNGILTDMRQYEVAQIPSLCKNYWSMDLMMKVLETVLSKIAQIIAIKIEEQKQSIIKQPDVKLIPIRFSVEIHVEGQEIILKVLPYSSIDIQSKTDLKSDILFSQRQ